MACWNWGVRVKTHSASEHLQGLPQAYAFGDCATKVTPRMGRRPSIHMVHIWAIANGFQQSNAANLEENLLSNACSQVPPP